MSDKTKHTPGPWASHAEVAGVIYGPDGYQVCTTPRTTRRETERDANARLIAAAPDLASALQGIIPAYEAALERLCELGQGFGACMSVKVLPAARAAIEQATSQEVSS